MKHVVRSAALGVVLGGMALVVACGGSSSPTSPSGGSGGGTGTAAATVTITASGVDPKEVTISAGQRVRFINNDTRSHDMSSDPHPTHTDCPEINQVGVIQVGQTKETGNLVTVRTCGFHDHNLPTNTSLQGRIVIR